MNCHCGSTLGCVSGFSRSLSIGRLVIATVAAGVVLAAMLFPLVGGAGAVTNWGADSIAGLSSNFQSSQVNGITTILAANGSVITHLYKDYRVPVLLHQISPTMQQAIISIEDNRFYQHGGIDLTGEARAVVNDAIAGAAVQGGSTLTQQLVKNTLLYSATTEADQKAAVEPTLARKLREAKIAIGLDKQLSKNEILKRYLNLVNFGGGAYGVQAAAMTYFGIAAAKLNIQQSALIAGIVQDPSAYNPLNNPNAATDRRNVVLAAMVKYHHITAAQGAAAKAAPLDLKPQPKPSNGCTSAATYTGFFCNYAVNYVSSTLGVPESTLQHGGLTIKTTLDPDMQTTATQAIINQPDFAMGAPKVATMDIVEPGTGKVLALAANRVFGPNAADPSQTMINLPVVASAGAGSTYKLFTAAAALEAGYTPDLTLSPGPHYTSKIEADQGVVYTVANAGKYPDTTTLQNALYTSMNTYFVNLEDVLGSVEPPVDMAKRMGLWAPGDPLPQQIIDEKRASFTLGPEPTSPLRLAVAYATVASGGTRCQPLPVVAIVDHLGKPLVDPSTKKPYLAGTDCVFGAIPTTVANTLAQILTKDVMPGNSGQTAERAYLGDGRVIAGKTGTAQNNFSYSFVGFTPQLTGSVLAYDPSGSQVMPNIGGGEGGFGGGYPAQIWHDAMQTIMADLPKVPIV